MPSHRAHRYLDRQLFGRSDSRVHVELDWPYRILGGKHRIFFHDPISACVIAQKCHPDDDDAVLAGLCHICLDEMCSNDPVFRAELGFLVEIDALEEEKNRKRKRKMKVKQKKKRPGASSRRKKKWSSDPLEEFYDFVRKVEQVQNLRRALAK